MTSGDGRATDPVPTADRLVAEAAALFDERGFHGASTREMAERLGITKASLYHHISSKDDLLFRVCAGTTRAALDAVTAAANDTPAPERLRAMVHRHLEVMLGSAAAHRVVLQEMRHLPPEYRGQVGKLRDDYTQLFRTVVAQDRADGRIRSDRSPALLAGALLSIINWPLFWFTPGYGASIGELADDCYDIFMEGAAAR